MEQTPQPKLVPEMRKKTAEKKKIRLKPKKGSYQICFDDFVATDVFRRRDVGELSDEIGELEVAGERRLVLLDELGRREFVTGADQLEVEVREQRVQELS